MHASTAACLTCRCSNAVHSACCAARVLAASSSPPVGSSSRCTCRGRCSAPTCCDGCSACASRVNTQGRDAAPLPASLSAAKLLLRLALALPLSEPWVLLPPLRPDGVSQGMPWGLITHAMCSSSYSTSSCTPAPAKRAASAATARASRSPDGSCTAAPARCTHCSTSPPDSVLQRNQREGAFRVMLSASSAWRAHVPWCQSEGACRAHAESPASCAGMRFGCRGGPRTQRG